MLAERGVSTRMTEPPAAPPPPPQAVSPQAAYDERDHSAPQPAAVSPIRHSVRARGAPPPIRKILLSLGMGLAGLLVIFAVWIGIAGLWAILSGLGDLTFLGALSALILAIGCGLAVGAYVIALKLVREQWR